MFRRKSPVPQLVISRLDDIKQQTEQLHDAVEQASKAGPDYSSARLNFQAIQLCEELITKLNRSIVDEGVGTGIQKEVRKKAATIVNQTRSLLNDLEQRLEAIEKYGENTKNKMVFDDLKAKTESLRSLAITATELRPSPKEQPKNKSVAFDKPAAPASAPAIPARKARISFRKSVSMPALEGKKEARKSVFFKAKSESGNNNNVEDASPPIKRKRSPRS